MKFVMRRNFGTFIKFKANRIMSRRVSMSGSCIGCAWSNGWNCTNTTCNPSW
jgi:hypothetical protein